MKLIQISPGCSAWFRNYAKIGRLANLEPFTAAILARVCQLYIFHWWSFISHPTCTSIAPGLYLQIYNTWQIWGRQNEIDHFVQNFFNNPNHVPSYCTAFVAIWQVFNLLQTYTQAPGTSRQLKCMKWSSKVNGRLILLGPWLPHSTSIKEYYPLFRFLITTGKPLHPAIRSTFEDSVHASTL